ncbi:MAG TPA: branched-chain amino acid ABC transporter permease, partial [Gemmataceae bacterium]|nr:branched-chain amino acid ABC transporter permease [Gemmataceae bacterium]
RVTGLPIGGRMPKLFIYAILALGLNVVVGYTGLLHLGIGAFFGIGAYLTGILLVPAYPFHKALGEYGFLAAIVLATLGAAGLSVVLSAPVLRLRGDYLALVTLGFGEVVRFALRNLQEITAGTKGLNPVPPPGFPFPKEWDWGDYRYFYFLTLGFLAVVLWLLWNLERSRLGRAWVAIREDELAATSMGVSSAKLKLFAFAVGAGLAGLAGCLYAHKQGGTADPDQYGFNTSILALLCLILGGIGNRKGVLLGVLLVIGFDEILSPIMDSYIQRSVGQAGPEYLRFSGWRLAVFGLALILVMRFRPEGIVPARRGT